MHDSCISLLIFVGLRGAQAAQINVTLALWLINLEGTTGTASSGKDLTNATPFRYVPAYCLSLSKTEMEWNYVTFVEIAKGDTIMVHYTGVKYVQTYLYCSGD